MKAFYLSILVAFAACGTSDQSTTANSDVAEAPIETSGVITDLSIEDMPLQVETPEGEEVKVLWREEFGHIEVTAGERFGLIITEDVGDIARKKADLERDLLQTHTVISEDERAMVYKSEFPDNEKLVFVHLYELLEVDNRNFIVSDMPSSQFKESDIAKMKGAVKALAAG